MGKDTFKSWKIIKKRKSCLTRQIIVNDFAFCVHLYWFYKKQFFFALQNTLANWSKVFYTTSGVYFVSATFYALFASAEPQPWIATAQIPRPTPSIKKTEL